MTKETTVTSNDNTPEYIDERALSARTSISRVTWQTWRARGKGPPYHRIGRRCLYRWAEVQAWLASKRVEPKAS